MKGESLGRLPADPGQPGQLGDQILDRAHRQKGGGNGSDGTFRISALQQLRGPALRLGDGGEHQVAQKLGVVPLEDGRIDASPSAWCPGHRR